MGREFSERPRVPIIPDGPDSDRRLLLSIVVPCLNEEEVLRNTNLCLTTALERIPADFEIIYIDDGSTDSTLAILRELQSRDKRIRVVRFSRNFGHQMAITAGLEHAAGDAIEAVIDAGSAGFTRSDCRIRPEMGG